MTTIHNQPIAAGDPRDRRHLVIGATGLVGRQVVREIAGRQWPVRGLRRWDSTAESIDFEGVDVAVGDIFEPAALAEAIAGVNGVIYCAAPAPGGDGREIKRRSVEAIRRVLAACRDFEVDRLVVTSSASTMGQSTPGKRLTEATYYLPGASDDPFAEAKYAVEQECYRYIADGFAVVMVNPTLVVGPGVDLTPYARLGVDDDQSLNAVDVRRVAKALANGLYRGRPGERYLVGGENTKAGALFDGWSTRGKNAVRPREAYLVECGQWVDDRRARQELDL